MKSSHRKMTKDEVLEWLAEKGSPRIVESMTRYGIRTKGAVGVSVGTLQKLAKEIGKDHVLAGALWKSKCYEARLLATLIDEPQKVTAGQMNAWAADFDSWAVCDSACFWLFDKSPLAYKKVPQWAKSKKEFVKRASFALMASLALHDKTADDKKFMAFFPLIEQAANDDRNFVKKGVSWGLRGIGRRGAAMLDAAVKVADRLAESDEAACRWVGKDALRDFAKVRARKKT